jgi:putative MATE family efflux protein
MTSNTLPAEQSSGGFWSDVRLALRGTSQDYTTLGLSRAIFLLAVPMVLEMAMESLFAVVDAYFVASLGRDSVSVVGLSEGILAIVYAAAMGLAAGTTATVARRIGEKHPEAASEAAFQAILLGLATSVIVGAVGVLWGNDLLRLMGASPEIIRAGGHYTVFLLGGVGSVFLLFLINAVFRGAGDPIMAMRTLWLANLLNILLNPCLIFGWGPFPRLGVLGSAVGTTVSRGVGVLFAAWFLIKGSGHLRLGLEHVRVDLRVMWSILRLSAGAALQSLITIASWVSLNRMNATFGSAAIAGYTLAIRTVIFVVLPAWGLCNAAATLVGQNLGAKRPDRAEQAVWRAGFYNALFLGAVAIAFWLFAPMIMRIFTSDAPVIAAGATCMRTISLAYPFLAYGMVMEQSFNGAGDTTTPIYINLLCYWAVQLPLAWWLSHRAGYGPKGVYISIAVGEALLAVVASLVFKRGRWKLKQV